MSKKSIIWLIIIIIIVGILIWYGVSRKPAEEEVIKIGAILPLTGTAASQGESERKAIEMAVEKKNAQGGIDNRKIEVIFEDDATSNSPSKATEIIKKLIYIDKVQFIIGPVMSSEIEAVAPIANQENIVMIAFGAVTSPFSRFGRNVFTSSATFASENYKIDEFIGKQNFGKIALISVNTEAGLEIKKVLEEELPKYNSELISTELINLGVIDFKTNLLKAKEQNPDALYVFHIPALLGIIIKQAKELSIEFPILTFHNIEDPSAKTTGGDSLEGVIYTSPVRSEIGKKFFTDFEQEYGSEPNIFSDAAYDAVNLIFEAIERNGLEIDKIREYLENIKNYQGATGNISFDKNRDIKRDYIIKTIKNGQFVPYEE